MPADWLPARAAEIDALAAERVRQVLDRMVSPEAIDAGGKAIKRIDSQISYDEAFAALSAVRALLIAVST